MFPDVVRPVIFQLEFFLYPVYACAMERAKTVFLWPSVKATSPVHRAFVCQPHVSRRGAPADLFRIEKFIYSV
jgi:hypothetical protein